MNEKMHTALAPQFHGASAERLLDDVVGMTPPFPARADGIAVGTIDGVGADGAVTVSIASLGLSRIDARTIVALDASHAGQQCALGFEAGDPCQPIVLGLMMRRHADAVMPVATEVVVDRERVVITAGQEIELRCGDAAIVMTSDGRIQLRGIHITSHASATQRILGGSVNIN